MEYRILGPLEVRANGQPVDLGGDRQRRILATLLLTPGQVVPLARLIAANWDGAAPPTARRQIQNRVADLRTRLTRFGGFIDTEESGYRLRLESAWLDVAAFDDLVGRALAVADAAMLRDALALWRESALTGLGGALLTRAAAALDEKRIDVLEDCLALELDAGRVGQLDELRALVAAHPLRERLVALLMRALAGTGARTEALALYERTAARLADDLGIDPSPELRRLHRSLAAGIRRPDRVVPQQRA